MPTLGKLIFVGINNSFKICELEKNLVGFFQIKQGEAYKLNMKWTMTEPPNLNYIMEAEFLDYVNYVLLDYDDERCQAQLRKMMTLTETGKKDNKQLD